MIDTDDNLASEILATLETSTIRLWGAFAIIAGLGILLLWIAATGATGSFFASFLLACFAATCFFSAYKIQKIRDLSVVLTREGLFDSEGRALCRTDQMASIDRSFLAFKPSNGFAIRLKARAEFTWVPGMWWRFGRSIGVGGITSVSRAKAMADMITLLLQNPELLDPSTSP